MNCTSTVESSPVVLSFFAASHPLGGKLCQHPENWPKLATFTLRARPEVLYRLMVHHARVAEFSDRQFHRCFAAALAWVFGGDFRALAKAAQRPILR